MLLAACGNDGDTKTEGDSVTLTMWNRYPELNQPFEAFIAGFEEEHSDITIELQNIPLASNTAQYQTAISENSLPDIFTTQPSLDELVELDLVKDLNEIFPEEVKDEFFPGTWFEGGTTLNDNVYVLPMFSPNHGVNMLYYNKNVLEEYGIAESDIPQTWDEMMTVGKQINEASNGSVYGFMWSNVDWANAGFVHMMATAISPNTPWKFDFKEGEPSFATEGNVESIEFLKQMYDEGVMHPMSIEVDTTKAEANFAAGKAAFYISGNWTGTNLIEGSDFEEWGVVDLPTQDGKPWYYMNARQADGLMVNNNTEHWEEVKVFLEYAKEHLYSEVILATGTTQPAKMDVEGELPFPQFEDILDLMTERAIPVPKPTERTLEIVDFETELFSRLGWNDIGEVAVGYMTESIDDIEVELNNLNEEANEVFNELLEEFSDVSKETYQFPDWEPFTPYEGAE
ncbi:ABC transporter substrate-binding protein [Gracilibacillus alcaliphilus]|nr:ABC-type glycerol-3-phosphate transport system substrate-binding protein [Gracilibacillus alcaliphilus]